MKKTSLTIVASSALAVVLAIGPGAAFAKSDKGESNLHGRAQAQASTTARSTCARAFGHLIAPGWIANHGTTTVSAACRLPFGIAKKQGAQRPNNPGAAKPDTIAPVISLITTTVGTSTATVTWLTNERADARLAFGTTTAYGSTSALDTALAHSHSVTLTGLAASTTYHFQAMSRDASGNLSTSTDRTFTTAPNDTVSPSISAVGVSSIGSTTAMVTWTTSEPATSKVYFAAGSSLDLNTASAVSSASLLSSHSLVLSGLSASTTYSYAVQSRDAFGNTSTSATSSFATGL